MARKSNIARNQKRILIVSKYAKKRQELKEIIANPKTTEEDFFAAQEKLWKLPRNSAPTRLKNRCALTGRPRAYLRRFGLSRITFREMASNGQIPGVTKSSW